jgi:hypothetical protein
MASTFGTVSPSILPFLEMLDFRLEFLIIESDGGLELSLSVSSFSNVFDLSNFHIIDIV